MTTSSVFTKPELAYLLTEFDQLVTHRRLARLATVGKDGTPHVVPVGWRYNAELDTIDIGGFDNEQTKKFRDVERSGRAAIVVDDLASTDPWRPRGVEVRGRAETVWDGRPLIRIHPERIVSWGIEGEALRSRPVSSERTGVEHPG
jgi:pyridoxamine 5'-phosphate oxidase family protein